MDATTLIELLNDQSYDSGREKMIDKLMKSLVSAITVDDLLGIIKCYSYDEGKVKAANQLLNGCKLVYNSSPSTIIGILNEMSYDPGRTGILRVIAELDPTISLKSLNEMMSCYSYDEGRIDCFKLFLNRPVVQVNTEVIIQGLSGFSYDKARFVYLEKLRLVLDVMKTEKSLEKLLGTFSYDHDKVIKLVKEKIELNMDDLCRVISQNVTGEANFVNICKEFKICDELIEKYKVNAQSQTSISIGGSGGISMRTVGNQHFINIGNYPPGSVVTINGTTIRF